MSVPTADQIALAIVEAARVHGDDPLSIARGGGGSRGRTIAYCALTEAFPDVTKARIARWCGCPSQSSASAHLIHARKAKWWSEDAIDEIVGALLADEVEEAAAPAAPVVARPSGIPAPNFHPDERLIIHRLWKRGEEAAAIGAAIGAEAHEIEAYARAWPDRCRPRGQA